MSARVEGCWRALRRKATFVQSDVHYATVFLAFAGQSSWRPPNVLQCCNPWFQQGGHATVLEIWRWQNPSVKKACEPHLKTHFFCLPGVFGTPGLHRRATDWLELEWAKSAQDIPRSHQSLSQPGWTRFRRGAPLSLHEGHHHLRPWHKGGPVDQAETMMGSLHHSQVSQVSQPTPSTPFKRIRRDSPGPSKVKMHKVPRIYKRVKPMLEIFQQDSPIRASPAGARSALASRRKVHSSSRFRWICEKWLQMWRRKCWYKGGCVISTNHPIRRSNIPDDIRLGDTLIAKIFSPPCCAPYAEGTGKWFGQKAVLGLPVPMNPNGPNVSSSSKKNNKCTDAQSPGARY